MSLLLLFQFNRIFLRIRESQHISLTMAQQTDYKFEGWMGLDANAADGKMVWQEFEPKPWEETDVDIKISHCGICGTDMHTLRSGWVSSHCFNMLSLEGAFPRGRGGRW